MAYSSYDRFGDVVMSGSGREADNQLASGCAAVIGRTEPFDLYANGIRQQSADSVEKLETRFFQGMATPSLSRDR
jgi:hypothetical protein